MKCILTRNDIQPSYPGQPFGWVPEDMRHLTETRTVTQSGREEQVVFWKQGETFEHPTAYKMVRMGVAIPADDDCRIRANMTVEQMTTAQHAYERQIRMIPPEDFDLYDAGVISGIMPDGSYKPGQHFDQLGEFRDIEPPHGILEEDDE